MPNAHPGTIDVQAQRETRDEDDRKREPLFIKSILAPPLPLPLPLGLPSAKYKMPALCSLRIWTSINDAFVVSLSVLHVSPVIEENTNQTLLFHVIWT
jgi:hypothetical protein